MKRLKEELESRDGGDNNANGSVNDSNTVSDVRSVVSSRYGGLNPNTLASDAASVLGFDDSDDVALLDSAAAKSSSSSSSSSESEKKKQRRGSEGGDDDDEHDDHDDGETPDDLLKKELEKVRKERERAKAASSSSSSSTTTASLFLPDLNSEGDSSITKKKWNEDVIFRSSSNAASAFDTKKKEFVNDSTHSEFHKRFMNKYIR